MKNKSRIYYAYALTKYIKGFVPTFAISVICTLLFKIMPVAIGVVTSYMISAALFGKTHVIMTMFFAVAVLIVVDAVFSYLDILVSHDVAYRILTKLRDKAYDKIDEIAPAALENKQSGDLTSIVLEDIELLEWFYAHTISQIIIAFVIPTFSLILLGLFSWILPIVVIPFIVILILLPKITQTKSDTQGMNVRKYAGILNAEIVDGVQGIKDIVSFRWQGEYFKRFFLTNKNYNSALLDYTKRSSNETRLINLMIEIAVLSGMCAAVILISEGLLDVIWLMPVFVLLGTMFSPIREALAMSTNYGLIFSAAKRLFNLLQMESVVVDKGTETSADVLRLNNGKDKESITVEFDNVGFTYPTNISGMHNNEVLKGLSFSFKTGETIALVGSSGSGKTTAARLLQRFWDVGSGQIRINGIDIRQIKLKDLRDIVTVVPQNTYLFNDSVEENLRLARQNAYPDEIIKASCSAQADSFIKKLPQGYNTVIGERGLRLSGGEKQRLSIAQAFLKNSPVLVLDEASANLDSENEKLINIAVNKLKNGRATLIIAHRRLTIRNSDRIVVLKEGKVESIGTYADLIKTCGYFGQLIGGEEFEE